jgi:hypothetical protein
MSDNADDAGFLMRWSRRKATARDGHAASGPAPAVDEARTWAPAPTPAHGTSPERAPAAASASPEAATPDSLARPAAPAPPASPPTPPPTLEDAARLTPQADFRRFVAPNVSPEVRNAALKQLFADPHFNVMDGLDTYIDDYGKPDPLPLGMLRKMAQAQFLNLFADEKKVQDDPPVAAAPHLDTSADEDPDLRLQPHDAAGPPGVEPGPGEDAGGQR